MKRYKLFIGAAILLAVFYVYIISVHRIQDFGDVRAIVDAVSYSSVSDRCKFIQNAEYRCLPNVLFIGASKCGTTSLVSYMAHHKGIKFINRRIHKDDKHREVHRFDRNTFGMALKSIELGDEWASSPVVSSPNVSVVHYTPHYLYAPTVPFEVKRFYPHESNLKFVVMLREPVKRAWSSYWFHNSHLIQGQDQGSVAEFLELARQEVEQRANYNTCMDQELLGRQMFASFQTRKISTNMPVYLQYAVHYLKAKHRVYVDPLRTDSSTSLQSTDELETVLYAANQRCFGASLRSPTLGTRHVDKGIYIDQIVRWFTSFRPDQFRFILLEDMATQPAEQFQDVLDFLDVPVTTSNTTSSSSSNSSSNSKLYMSNNNENSSSMRRVYDPVIQTLNFRKKRLETPNSLMPAWDTLTPADTQFLYDFYKPYNALLCEMGVHCGY